MVEWETTEEAPSFPTKEFYVKTLAMKIHPKDMAGRNDYSFSYYGVSADAADVKPELADDLECEKVLISHKIRKGGTLVLPHKVHPHSFKISVYANEPETVRRWYRDAFARHKAEFEQTHTSHLLEMMMNA